MRSYDIREIREVSDILLVVVTLKWQWVGHTARREMDKTLARVESQGSETKEKIIGEMEEGSLV